MKVLLFLLGNLDDMLNKYIITLTLLFCSILVSAQNMTRKEYIEKYKDLAIKKMKSHGIPASITLAQGCLESANGNSKLAVEGKNHFGIKCHEWDGETIGIDDDSLNECFRKYQNVEDSYDDHGDFLKYRERYSGLFDLEITDYKGWAHGLKKAGYATNPQYAQTLIRIIEENNLTQYDREQTVIEEKQGPKYIEDNITILRRSNLYKYSSRTLYVSNDNNTPFIIAEPGDTYKSIAKEYHLFSWEIRKFNKHNKKSYLILLK